MRIGVHQHVHEYDGAFFCFNCAERWGAFPGLPKEPAVCTPRCTGCSHPKHGPGACLEPGCCITSSTSCPGDSMYLGAEMVDGKLVGASLVLAPTFPGQEPVCPLAQPETCSFPGCEIPEPHRHVTVSAPPYEMCGCRTRYYDQIVRCELPIDHPGSHRKEGGGWRWEMPFETRIEELLAENETLRAHRCPITVPVGSEETVVRRVEEAVAKVNEIAGKALAAKDIEIAACCDTDQERLREIANLRTENEALKNIYVEGVCPACDEVVKKRALISAEHDCLHAALTRLSSSEAFYVGHVFDARLPGDVEVLSRMTFATAILNGKTVEQATAGVKELLDLTFPLMFPEIKEE